MRAAGFALLALLSLNACVSEPITLTPEQQEDYDEFFHHDRFSDLPHEDQLLIKQYMEIKAANEYNQQSCEKYWHLSWALAKRGYPAGRMTIMLGMAYANWRLPGSSQSNTEFRDTLILTIHSLGAEKLEEYIEQRRRAHYVEMFSKEPSNLAQNPRFRECLLHGELTDCSRIAVEEKLVPSFEEFAAEIDAAGPEAVTAMCHNALKQRLKFRYGHH